MGKRRHSFTNLDLNTGREWSASRPDRFTTREKARGIHWIGGWVGPRAGLEAHSSSLLNLQGIRLENMHIHVERALIFLSFAVTDEGIKKISNIPQLGGRFLSYSGLHILFVLTDSVSFLQHNITKIILKHSGPSLQRAYLPIKKSNDLILDREIIAVCHNNRKIYINTRCRKNAEFLRVKASGTYYHVARYSKSVLPPNIPDIRTGKTAVGFPRTVPCLHHIVQYEL
jgi:hypothetical protein